MKLVIAIGLLLVTACAPAQQDAADRSMASTPGVEKQYGGIFLKAPQPVLETLFWYDRVNGANSGQRSSLSDTWDTLLTYVYTTPDQDYRSEIGPNLAESWKQVDSKTYEFTIRKGVKFHDGVDLTAKDVVFSYERMREGSSAQSGVTRGVEKVEAPDPYTVRFTVRQISPDFVALIGTDNSTAFRILPAHVAEQAGNPTGDGLKQAFEKNPVGSGPFKFRSFVYNQHLELERFEGYWKGKPYMDGIRSVQRLDDSAQLAAYIAGKVDFLSLTDRVQFETVKSRVPETKKVTYTLSNGVGLEFNIKRKPFDDVRVRRAFHLGVDRQAMVQTVTFGEGDILAPVLQPDQTHGGIGIPQPELLKLPGWRQPKEQDLAEAKRLLTEAGFPPGSKLTLRYQKGSNNPSVQTEPVANLLKQNLGIDVSVLAMEDAAYLSQVQKDRDFEAVVSVQAAGVGDTLSVNPPNKWHSKGGLNYNGYEDPEMDRIMEALQVEIDSKKRNELLVQAQRLIIDKAYYAPLIALAQYNAVQGWVNDFYTSYSANTAPRNMAATWLEVNNMPADRRSW